MDLKGVCVTVANSPSGWVEATVRRFVRCRADNVFLDRSGEQGRNPVAALRLGASSAVRARVKFTDVDDTLATVRYAPNLLAVDCRKAGHFKHIPGEKREPVGYQCFRITINLDPFGIYIFTDLGCRFMAVSAMNDRGQYGGVIVRAPSIARLDRGGAHLTHIGLKAAVAETDPPSARGFDPLGITTVIIAPGNIVSEGTGQLRDEMRAKRADCVLFQLHRSYPRISPRWSNASISTSFRTPRPSGSMAGRALPSLTELGKGCHFPPGNPKQGLGECSHRRRYVRTF